MISHCRSFVTLKFVTEDRSQSGDCDRAFLNFGQVLRWGVDTNALFLLESDCCGGSADSPCLVFAALSDEEEAAELQRIKGYAQTQSSCSGSKVLWAQVKQRERAKEKAVRSYCCDVSLLTNMAWHCSASCTRHQQSCSRASVPFFATGR